MKSIVSLVFVLILAIAAKMCLFILPEDKQAIITQFGKPVGDPITAPGLHFKNPVFHKVLLIEKRILTWDGYPNQIPTKDKKYISVDTSARWKIIDPLLFIQTVQNERGAQTRLNNIIDAITRDTISSNRLVEAVRNSNSILDRRKELKESDDPNNIEEEVMTEIESIKVGRERLSKIIAEKSNLELKSLGIEVIDVQLRRISYEESVEAKVYERMISERQRIAEKIRSIGKGEKAKIEGRLSKDLQQIQSTGYRKAEEIKGRGEATSIKIYAQAFGRDPKFYEFLRSMEAYKKALKPGTNLILSSDSAFLKYFREVK